MEKLLNHKKQNSANCDIFKESVICYDGGGVILWH